MNTGMNEQELNEVFDGLLENIVTETYNVPSEETRQELQYEEDNQEYVEQLDRLIEGLLIEDEVVIEEDEQVVEPEPALEEDIELEEESDNENNVSEDLFTVIMETSNENMIRRFEQATNQTLLELVEPEQVDVVIFHLLSEQEKERVINHKVASLSFTDIRDLADEIDYMKAEYEMRGLTVEQYLQQDLSEGIPFVEDEEDDEVNTEDVEVSFADLNREQDEPEVEQEVIESVEEEQDEQDEQDEPEQETTYPINRTTRHRRGNDYGLAWDIYTLGYASGDIAHIYDLSAGSITRGMKDLGHEMRTGAETRAMRKVDPDEFSQELLDRIFELLEDKFDTEEGRNEAFYNTFNKNIYELTLHEAEDETIELQEMQEQASLQGISLQEYARMEEVENVYEERERSEFVNNVRYLHSQVKEKARELFGDVNVDVGSVDVESKVTYENGIVLSVKEAYKLDGKAVDATNVTFSMKVAEFIVQSFEREIEEMVSYIEGITQRRFNNNAPLTRLGNRLVVGLDNE